jgi:chromosome partitioning protein
MGVKHLEELIQQIREHMRHETLRIGGVLLTKVQRTNVAEEVEYQVRSYFGERVFGTIIPVNVKVEEAHSRGLSVADYAPDSSGAKAYIAFAEEVLRHG